MKVGGQRGREALDRLRNGIGRVESSWRPASMEEGFEIVRRRLFEPLIDQEQHRFQPRAQHLSQSAPEMVRFGRRCD